MIKGENKDKESEEEEKKNSKTRILNVATVTFANGGDNIGTYVPLFATLTTSDKTVMISIFLTMVLIGLTTARYLTNYPVLTKVISKYGHIITPIVLCLLGLFI